MVERQPRALPAVERKQIKARLESNEFIEQAPAAVNAHLMDQGVYPGSVSTRYRVPHEHDEVFERRRQAVQQAAHKKPELITTRPNEIWSWHITKLHRPQKWTHHFLYVILDILFRYVVGWTLARTENAALSTQPMNETIVRQGIINGQLTINAHRESPMIAKPAVHLLADPRSHQATFSISHEQPQSLQREPVPHLQVTARLSRLVRQFESSNSFVWPTSVACPSIEDSGRCRYLPFLPLTSPLVDCSQLMTRTPDLSVSKLQQIRSASHSSSSRQTEMSSLPHRSNMGPVNQAANSPVAVPSGFSSGVRPICIPTER